MLYEVITLAAMAHHGLFAEDVLAGGQEEAQGLVVGEGRMAEHDRIHSYNFV